MQSNIDVETGRIDAILEASDADKDSFAEIVTLINSVDTTNDLAFAGYVASNDAAVAALQADVDGNESDADAAIAALQADVNQNEADADAAIAALQADVNQNKSDADAAIAAVASDLASYETSNDAALAAETTAREAADTNEATLRSGSIAAVSSSLLTMSASLAADFASADAATTAVLNNYITSNRS